MEVYSAAVPALTPLSPPVQDGTTALHYASQNGHLEVVFYLLQNGATLDLLDVSRLLPWEALLLLTAAPMCHIRVA